MIDPELRDIITPELAEGEELVWAGRPSLKYWYRNLLYGVFITGFVKILLGKHIYVALTFFAETVQSGDFVAILIASLIALGFFVFPLVMLGLCWRHALKSLFEYYAVTSRRIIIIEKIWPSIKFEIPLSSIKSIDDQILIYPNSVRIVSELEKHPGFFGRFRSFNRQRTPWAKYRHKHYQFFLRQLSNTNQIKAIISQSMRTAS